MADRAPAGRPWVFLDIGNVIWSDDENDAFTLENIGKELGRAGCAVDSAELVLAAQVSIAAYAPSVWQAVIWRFTSPDRELYESIAARVKAAWDGIDDERYRAFTPPYPGVDELLADLAARHPLGIASNNSPRALRRLGELGFLRHFTVQEVSDTLGLAKPDIRFFMALLEEAGCRPEDAVMVGDRLGNDIAPARLLGMKTIRVLQGWHRPQQPRSPEDLPDLEVAASAEIGDALRRLLP